MKEAIKITHIYFKNMLTTMFLIPTVEHTNNTHSYDIAVPEVKEDDSKPLFEDKNLQNLIELKKQWQTFTMADIRKKYKVAKRYNDDLEEFVINQNFPNPFNPSTQISIEVLVDSNFEIVVYSLEGKEVGVLHNGFLAKGKYQFKCDGSELPSGIYLYKVSSPNFSRTKKMILAKWYHLPVSLFPG